MEIKMKTSKVELNVTDPSFCQLMKDPYQKHTHLETFLSFEEVAKLKRGNANVRPPEQKKKPFKAMLQTVEQTPELFNIKNRGIYYICTDAFFDVKTNKLTVTIPESSELRKGSDRFGVADGGHTYEIIKNTIRDIKDYDNIVNWKMPYVRVHFLVVRDQENIEQIVEALNTSLQVQQYTLDEYQNKFEWIKSTLKQNGFDPGLVAFRENEDKEWNVIEIIQRAACFLKERWIGVQPINMYKSKGKALKSFTNETTRGDFKRLANVLVDAITLPEYIQSQLSRGDIVPAKSLVKLKGV